MVLRAVVSRLLLLVAIGQLLVHLLSSVVWLNVVMPLVRGFMLVTGLKKPLKVLQSFLLRVWMAPFMHHMEIFGGLRLEVTGDAFREGESALVVANHRGWVDSIVMYSTSRQIGANGNVKYLAKRSLLFFPVLGLVGQNLDVTIFIKREAGKAAGKIQKLFHSLSDPDAQHQFWMISFLEGTRLTKAKLQAAQEFAKKRELKPLNHLLQPRVKGFLSSVNELRGNVSAVYDITIGYDEDEDMYPDPSFLYIISNYCFGEPRKLTVHQRRIPIEQVPVDDDEAKAWVYKLYEEKDALLETRKQNNGKFPGRTIPWTPIKTPYAVLCFFGFNLSAMFLLFAAFTLLRPSARSDFDATSEL